MELKQVLYLLVSPLCCLEVKVGRFLSLILLSVKSENPARIVSREEAVAGLVGTVMGRRVQLPVPME